MNKQTEPKSTNKTKQQPVTLDNTKKTKLTNDFDEWKKVQDYYAKKEGKTPIGEPAYKNQYIEGMKKSAGTYRQTARMEVKVAFLQSLMAVSFYGAGGAFGLAENEQTSYFEGTDDIVARILKTPALDPDTPLGAQVCQ